MGYIRLKNEIINFKSRQGSIPVLHIPWPVAETMLSLPIFRFKYRILSVELEERLSDLILQQNNPRATSKSTRVSLWSCDGTNRGDQRRLLTYTITKINIKKSRFTTIIIVNAFDLNRNHSKLQVGSGSRAPLPQVSAPSPQGPEPSEASPGPWLL